jgi:hypothetical protein
MRKKLFSQDLYLVTTSSLGIDGVGDALATWSQQNELIAHVELVPLALGPGFEIMVAGD